MKNLLNLIKTPSMNAFPNKLTKKKGISNLMKQRKGYHLEVFWKSAVREYFTGGKKCWCRLV